MEKLKELGLTQYEITIYLTLLKKGTLTGSKVFNLSKIPSGKAYESLIKLEDKGLILVTKTKPKEFTAINPNIAIKNLAKDKIESLEKIKSDSIKQLNNLKNSNRNTSEIRERIKIGAGRESIFPIVLDMYENSKKEIKEIFTYEVRPFSHIKAVKKAIKKGIKVKFLITKKPTSLSQINKDLDTGIEIRYYPIDELRFVIKDSSEVIQTLINPRDENDRISIYAKSKSLAKAIDFYFEEIWKKAEIIKQENN